MSESTKIEGLVKTAMAVYKGEAKLLQLSMNATKENAIINMVPEVIDKITDFLGKKSDDEDEDEE